MINRVPADLKYLVVDGSCQLRHSQYLERNGFKYCPWCATLLKVLVVCEHCGQKFLSEAAYAAHKKGATFLKANPCPDCGQTKNKYLKTRGRMFCIPCQREYPLRETARDA